ncbi:superinfection exclusion B family protein [Bacillus cabrialesii]|uniref:Superinfection exclusion B family protein n=2 Tax=Bacillus TaxID=1386 RepID=A0ABT9DIL4_9BACI|nr:superinfection exclusion B family protein [Bacillus cabrialesii]MDO8224539.1 superinfection exclusion B family protein [Bacillus cabrialesii subsp. tritici]
MKVDIKDILTLPTYILTALALASGLFLFLPRVFLEKLHLLDNVEKYGFYVGVAFIVFTSIVLVSLSLNIIKSISQINNKREFYAKAEERLISLSPYQKAIIYALFTQYDNTLPLKLHDGAVQELKAKFYIGVATQQYAVSNLNEARFPHLLQPWVREEMSKKPQLIDEFESCFYNYREFI